MTRFLVAMTLLFTSACTQKPVNVSGIATAWAKTMNLEVKGISCLQYDTDFDGYYSCTVSTATGVVGIECSPVQNGCRTPKASPQ